MDAVSKPTDFNDQMQNDGVDALTEQITSDLHAIEDDRRCADDALKSTDSRSPEPNTHVNVCGNPESWEDDLVRNENGKLQNTLANVYLFLRFHPAWKGVIVHNEFSGCTECRSAPPWGGPGNRPWNDIDDSRTGIWLADQVGLNTQTKVVAEAVQTVSHDRTVHPVREYLTSHGWDGVERLGGLLATYFGATESDDASDPLRVVQDAKYKKLVSIKVLVGAVARVMDPGCKNDTVLILEGNQGAGKSTALSVLAGPAWFLDTAFAIGDKDAYIAMPGHLFIELAELDSFNKVETTKAKAFFSSRIDKYREPYGRRLKSFPRQCIFIGTTNQHEYLRDETGNRRYWPVRCGRIDIDALKRDRDQLWAEALHLYRSGVKHWVTDEECEIFNLEQTKRQLDDPWLEVINDWAKSRSEFTMVDVITKALALWINPERMDDRGMRTRVGKCLNVLGYVKRQKANATPRYYYIKSSNS